MEEEIREANELIDRCLTAQKKILKSGLLTTEFLSVILVGILGILKGTVYPDIPEESFYTVAMYIISRTILKLKTLK
jgi:hypothetical protein